MAATQTPSQHQESDSSYTESPQIVLSERDSIAVVNSIKYPGTPNELLRETMRKNKERR